MCGIVGVITRRDDRPAPEAAHVFDLLDSAAGAVVDGDLRQAGLVLSRANDALRGVPGVTALLLQPELEPGIWTRVESLTAHLAVIEGDLETRAGLESRSDRAVDELETRSAEIIAVKDLLWSISRDRLAMARSVGELLGAGAGAGAGAGVGGAAIAAYLSIQQTLAGIDRLEVRGRDSAGVHVFISGHGLDEHDPEIIEICSGRVGDPLFLSGAVVWSGPVLSIVYKAAAEIGELGDNTRVIRAAIMADPLLRRAVAHPGASVAVLGHTRWASVGIISEPNTHPLNSTELVAGDPASNPASACYVVAALNGDVDNHADLRVDHGLRLPASITTDAKIIPAIISRQLQAGNDLSEAFRRTVGEFEGSVAIAAMSAEHPDQMLLALRGSGQGLFIGVCETGYIVASEPYGLVEETDRYLRLDGENGGEIVLIDRRMEGSDPLSGLSRFGYDGLERPIESHEIAIAEVTTRDIDRGDAPHFLLKEISEAPESLRRTVRGKTATVEGRLRAALGERSLPREIVQRLQSAEISRIRVIGQGTAAVAGQGIAMLIEALCGGALDVRAVTATELSGFQMRIDMSDTLAIAVSQSGTTTDTNRTVDLLRSRGAAVIGIVNRRNSDLVDKSDGVLFTSDGRDVEMSVASTKAFYAQIAAGTLIAAAIAEAAGLGNVVERDELLRALTDLPEAMRQVLEQRPVIAEIASRFAPARRYWAVVGNGPNRVAAEEIRIKLSELCYKSIACDNTEDKKHIDLSAEPLIIVCAAGLGGSTADDVAKETAIFRAHKAVPIVIADEGEGRYSSAATIWVPAVHPQLGFVLSAMAGHLFGYEAARAIDQTAVVLRSAREAVERAVTADDDPDRILAEVIGGVAVYADRFEEMLAGGDFDGQLEARTAVQLSSLLRDLRSDNPVEEYQRRSGRVGDPAAVIDELVTILTRAIEELTRPIDAIKHQAKTVTVGISRSDEGVLDRALVQAVLAAGSGRDRLGYRTLKVLADLDPAVADVIGFTRYAIDHNRIEVIDRGGIARDLPSRVDRINELVGTKRRVVAERQTLVARGRSDGRTVILVPETKGNQCTGITLLHVRFHDRIDALTMRSVLQGYDQRYDRLVDWVTETEGSFDDTLLGELPVADLLIGPISEAADAWRQS